MPDLSSVLMNPTLTAGDYLYGVSGQYGGTGNGTGAGQFARNSRSAPSAMAALGDQGQGGSGWGMPLDPGGVFGQQKWMPGNGIDIFTRRGAPVYAMFDGTVSPYGVPGPGGQIGGMLLQGDNGYSMQSIHTQISRQGRVRKGDIIGTVGDPSMDMLGPYQGMPDGFQHLDLTIGRGRGPFPLTGGDVNASQWLQQNGYGSPSVGQTRGPNGGGGGGMPGMGGMGMPGMGGGPMGMGGMPGMMGGMPGMMGGGMGGMGMGMPPMFGGGMGMGMPPMMGLPPMGGGFGQFGMQQGLIPGSAGVGGGQFGGNPFGQGTAMGPVMSSPGTYGGPNPMLPFGAGMGGGGGFPGLGNPFGGFNLGSIF